MAIVKRANVVLRVTDAELPKYLAKGYDVIDEYGHVIQEAEPHDAVALRGAYIRYKNQVIELKAEIEKRDAEIERLKAELEKAKQRKATKNSAKEAD